jgi:2-polyprenyl-3-methyl-5-hydroxy-6-metoxy-1,4-benzoquinol methylase
MQKVRMHQDAGAHHMGTLHADKAAGLNLRRRDRQPERLDHPELDRSMRRHALDGLKTINWFSRTASTFWPEIQRIGVEARGLPLRILDVGSGGGDVAVWLGRRAAAAGLPWSIEGCDISPVAVEHATEHAAARRVHNVRFFTCGALADSIEEQYDVVICSLFLHHFDEREAVLLLNRMNRVARRAVLVSDLRRTRLGYGLAWLGCRVLTRSPIVHTDGLLSVAAAFTPSEARVLAERAGLLDIQIQLHWPQRFLLLGRPAK